MTGAGARDDLVLAAACGDPRSRAALGAEAPPLLPAPSSAIAWPDAVGLGGPVGVTIGALALAVDLHHFGRELAELLRTERAGRTASALHRRLDEVRPTLERVRRWCEAEGDLPGVRLTRGPLPAWHEGDSDHREPWRAVAADVSKAAEDVADFAGRSELLANAAVGYGNALGLSAARSRDPLGRGYYVADHLRRLWRTAGPADPERPPNDAAIALICHEVVTEALVAWALRRELPALDPPG